jgi:hypothetical protein
VIWPRWAVPERLAAVEHGEAVAHSHRMTDIVGDEDHTDSLFADLVDGGQNIGGLAYTERRGRLIQDENLGAEM